MHTPGRIDAWPDFEDNVADGYLPVCQIANLYDALQTQIGV